MLPQDPSKNVAPNRVPGASTTARGVTQPTEMNAARQYAQMFGGYTPQARVSGMPPPVQNMPVGMIQPQTRGMAPPKKPSGPDPASAGTMNAAVPGAFTNNPANGYSGAELGFMQPGNDILGNRHVGGPGTAGPTVTAMGGIPGRTATPTAQIQNIASAFMGPQQAQAPQQQAPAPTLQAGAIRLTPVEPVSEAPAQTTPQTGLAQTADDTSAAASSTDRRATKADIQKGVTTSAPTQASAPVDPATGLAPRQPSAAQTATAPQATQAPAEPTVYTRGDPATYFAEDGTPKWTAQDVMSDDRPAAQKFIKPVPAAYAGWNAKQKANWRAANYNPYDSPAEYIKNVPWEQGYVAYKNAVADRKALPQTLPSPDDVQQQIQIPSDATLAQITAPGSSLRIENEELQRLWDASQNAYTNLRQFSETAEGLSSKEYQNALATYNLAINTLGRFGIQYDPLSDYANAGNPDTREPGFDDTRSGEGGASDTDIPTSLPSFDKTIQDLRKALNGDPNAAALLEFAMQRALSEQGMQRQQQGVNLLQPNVEMTLAENNPFRKASEDAMIAALANPDPTDWQGIQNRYVSDSDALLNQGTEALSTSSARRGISPGAMAGLQSQMQRENANTQARGLGELRNQQAVQGRDALYRAIQQSANVDANYRGAESVARQVLANAVMGVPQSAINPYSGIADTRAGMDALKLQEEALSLAGDQADNQLIGSGIGALGSIAAAFI